MTAEKRKSNAKLYVAVFSVNLASFTAGTAFAWTSSSLPRLNGSVDPQNNPLKTPVTQLEESWIASILAIGAICSTFLGGLSSDKIGRKKTLIIETIPLFVGFTIIIFARQVWHFLIARFLCGLAIGGLFVTLPNYVAEISDKTNRGTLSCFLVLSITLGNLLIFSIGPFLPIKYSGVICLIPPTLFFLCFSLYAPESPYYLIAQNKCDKAEVVLYKLRNRSSLEVMREFEEIEKVVRDSELVKSSFFEIFKSRSNLRKLFITAGLMTFQQFSGINCILFYLQKIFDSSGSSLAPELAAIIIATVQFCSALIAPALIEKLGRRILLFISAFGTLIPLIAIGVFYKIKELQLNYEQISFLPIVSLVVFILGYSCAFGPVPFTILGEIFAPNVKAAASTLSVALCFLFTFVTTAGFPTLLILIGEAASFWLFACFCALSVFFIYFFVPETKGKSLYEIQEMLK